MIDFVKSVVRPYLIMSAWTFGLVMAGIGQWENIPTVIQGAIGAITAEYIVERAKKRLTEKNNVPK